MTMRAFLLLFVCFVPSFVIGSDGAVEEAEESASESTVFRQVGSFKVTRAVLVKLGQTTEVEKGELILNVFTDEIDIRISPENQDDDYLAFQIYRNGGILDPTTKDLLPGVQAFSDQGEVVRHLVLNSKLLTLTKFPTSTGDVEIIYATRYER